MMINIEARKRICIFNFSAEDQTLQTTISSYENVVRERIFVNRKPGLQVDLLTRARACEERARAFAGGRRGPSRRRDEGTKGRRDKGTKGRRDRGTTVRRDDKRGEADEGTKGQREEETKGRREDETEGRRYEGTTNEATKGRRHEGRRDDKRDW